MFPWLQATLQIYLNPFLHWLHDPEICNYLRTLKKKSSLDIQMYKHLYKRACAVIFSLFDPHGAASFTFIYFIGTLQ